MYFIVAGYFSSFQFECITNSAHQGMFLCTSFGDDFIFVYFCPVLVVNLVSLLVNDNRPNCDQWSFLSALLLWVFHPSHHILAVNLGNLRVIPDTSWLTPCFFFLLSPWFCTITKPCHLCLDLLGSTWYHFYIHSSSLDISSLLSNLLKCKLYHFSQ